METAQLIKAFAATVQASLHGLESLAALLQQEQDAVLGKDPEHLEQLARDKLELLKQLEYGVQARDRLQKAAGYPAGFAGGSGLVSKLDQAPLSKDWQSLTDLGERVAEHNNRNGQLVMQQQHATRSALEILTGRLRQEDTYSTLRRKRGGIASYSLGKV